MIGYVMMGTNDLAMATLFYDAVLNHWTSSALRTIPIMRRCSAGSA